MSIPTVPCSECDGTGENGPCQTCDGEGTHYCSRCESDHDCGHCSGSGIAPGKCSECDGTGRSPDFRSASEREHESAAIPVADGQMGLGL